ncbi:MAG: VacJ family lipoprotein [Betaproteobacteria bacterium]|nr:MAG: VacJ family lipoprotein [Betaproteobacteria bacterium]
MSIMLWRFLGLSLLVALLGLGGCATVGGTPGDPLEGYNRAMFGFNDGVDKAIIKPLASGYKTIMPEVARIGVTNFFANLGDLWIGINNILQGKVGAGVSDFGRFAINTTVGILGLFDVASNAGLEKHNEDFGQTLGRWGVGSGAYVVLPILGPSNVRDGISLLALDWRGDPLWYVGNIPTRNELVGVRAVDNRANLLDLSRLAEEAALDHYAYERDAFLQRRRSLIYDGDPLPEPDPAKTSESGASKDTSARAETEFPPARITTQWGERVVTAADEELTPAQEFFRAAAQPVAARPEAAAVGGATYEPRIPLNYEALLAVSGEVRDGLVRTSLRPR